MVVQRTVLPDEQQPRRVPLRQRLLSDPVCR